MYRVYIATTLAICTIANTHANPLLKGFTAHYDVSRNGMALGVIKRELVADDDGTLTFLSTTIAEGMVALFVKDIIAEESTILFKNNVLKPLRYQYLKTGGKKQQHIAVTFDWGKNIFSHSTTKKSSPLPADSHDLLSFQLDLSKGLSQGQEKFAYTIIDHKRVQTHSLRITGKETLSTSKGKLLATRLEQEKNNHRYWFTFWCVPELHYLPIIIRKTEYDGDKITMRLRQYNGQAFKIKKAGDDDF